MEDGESIFTWHLHLTGQVQGIGFRPAVYRIAQQFGLVGFIKNEADGLHVVFNANESLAEKFKTETCYDALPPLATLSAIHFTKLPNQEFSTFEIIHGDERVLPNLILTPDVALCHDCSLELADPKDRRSLYAFNSCSQCGPRYSIIEDLPYDRVNTKMDPFKLCKDCSGEYDDPSDRRYYAQAISCPNCAVDMYLYNGSAELITSDSDKIIDQIPQFWRDGSIIAIKGIGGYLLTCDAKNVALIKRLRKLKYRPSKPLAVMYPTIKSLEGFSLSKETEKILSSHISPIVLIPKVDKVSIAAGICDAQDHLGVMLPYAPIFKVLLNNFQGPIVATSGNRSKEPIVYKDDQVFDRLSEIADYILTNQRDIVVPQDDSVIKFSEIHQQKIVLRRSRGLAPSYFDANLKLSSLAIIATGAQMKSSFSLQQQPNVYVSQYLGDLESFETMNNYKDCLAHLIGLLKIKPEAILSDQHEAYDSTQYGYILADKWKVPIHLIPHHEAHFSAILGEHNLMESKEPVLGVIWDGAGLGKDGAIWGSEFFTYQNFEFNRSNHLSYYDLLLGDKMSNEPRISALSLAFDIKEAHEILEKKFTHTEWKIYIQKLQKGDHMQTSSMGRLFDAVATLLDLKDKQSFEGEAAILLEGLARSFYKEKGINWSGKHYFNMEEFKTNLSARKMIERIIEDLGNGIDRNQIAAKFHLTLIRWIEEVANRQDCKKIAFSGGVFQNSLLVDLAIEQLSKDYKLYFHQELSPNDENISFGQLIYHEIAQKLAKNE